MKCFKALEELKMSDDHGKCVSVWDDGDRYDVIGVRLINGDVDLEADTTYSNNPVFTVEELIIQIEQFESQFTVNSTITSMDKEITMTDDSSDVCFEFNLFN